MTKEETIKYGNDYYRDLITACCEISEKHKEFVRMSLEALEQKPRKGHWKVVSDGYSDTAYICECSECKDTVWVYKDADRKWNYCPNCGADMREVEE